MLRVALPLALALAAAAAHAQRALGPAKVSEIVTLAASFDPPTCSDGSNGARLDRIVTPEGTYVPLVVPPKRVVVITEIRWIADIAPNEEASAVVRPGPEQPGFIGIVLPGARADANGRVTGEAKLSPGLVVRHPADLCVRVFQSGGGSTAPGNLSGAGFFAKDK
jgi:hypothetical protein